MKSHLNVSIEADLLAEGKARGFNFSALLEEAVRERLVVFKQKQIPENCNHEFTWPFATPAGLVKECKKCGIFKKVELESHKETIKRYNKMVKNEA